VYEKAYIKIEYNRTDVSDLLLNIDQVLVSLRQSLCPTASHLNVMRMDLDLSLVVQGM
jgi:hypothetical protein